MSLQNIDDGFNSTDILGVQKSGAKMSQQPTREVPKSLNKKMRD